MQTQIIKIGNSQGIRIPKVLIQDLNLHGQVQLTSTDQGLLISPDKPRSSWDQDFKMADASPTNDDKSFLDLTHQWDKEEWQW